jgi:hypothetical protein
MNVHHPTAIRLAAYSDGELGKGAAREVEHHLKNCAQCQAELATLHTLSVRLQEFRLPNGMGEDTWEHVLPLLPERQTAAQPSSGGFLRWLPPIGLIASNAMLQAVVIVALGLWTLSSLGLFDWRELALPMLPAAGQLPGLSPEDAIGYLLSWLVAAPLGPGFSTLTRAWGADMGEALSWLVPSGLTMVGFASLALLYLGWLLAYWNVRSRGSKLVSRAA